MSEPLWTARRHGGRDARRRARARCRARCRGLSIDTRTIRPGEAFFAIQGENRDGHDFVEAALQAGAGLAVVAESKRGAMPPDAPLLVVPDVLAALNDLATASRARSSARIVAVTGSVGKTGTKEALRLVLGRQGETHASAASYNNHWGVPLSLALMPRSAKFGVFEIGMNHAGEITPLTQLRASACGDRHHDRAGASGILRHRSMPSRMRRRRSFSGVEPGGAAVINADIAQFARLSDAAQTAGIERIVSFGEREGADARLVKAVVAGRDLDRAGAHSRDGCHLQARRARPSRGRQFARRARGGEAARRRPGARGARARRAEAAGRARRARHARRAGRQRAADRRELQCESDLDGGGARGARTGAGAPARPAHRGARRHARARSGGCEAACGARRERCAPTRSIWCSVPGR